MVHFSNHPRYGVQVILLTKKQNHLGGQEPLLFIAKELFGGEKLG